MARERSWVALGDGFWMVHTYEGWRARVVGAVYAVEQPRGLGRIWDRLMRWGGVVKRRGVGI